MSYDSSDFYLYGSPPNNSRLIQRQKLKNKKLKTKKPNLKVPILFNYFDSETETFESIYIGGKKNQTKNRKMERKLKNIDSDSNYPPSTTVLTTQKFKCLDSKPVDPKSNVNKELKKIKSVYFDSPNNCTENNSQTNNSSSNSQDSLSNSSILKSDRANFIKTFTILIDLGKGRESKRAERQKSCEEEVFKNQLSDLLWLELNARLNNLTINEQDLLFDKQRKEVDCVLTKLRDFRISNSETSLTNQNLQKLLKIEDPTLLFETSSCCCNENSFQLSKNKHVSNCQNILGSCLNTELNLFIEPTIQVMNMLVQLDFIQSLYPNLKALHSNSSLFSNDSVQKKIICLTLWFNITSDLVRQIAKVFKLVTYKKQTDFSLWWCFDRFKLSVLLHILENFFPDKMESLKQHFCTKTLLSLPEIFSLSNENIIDFLIYQPNKNEIIDRHEDSEEEDANFSLIDNSDFGQKNESKRSTSSIVSSDSFELFPSSTTSIYRRFVERFLKTHGMGGLMKKIEKMLDFTLNKTFKVLTTRKDSVLSVSYSSLENNERKFEEKDFLDIGLPSFKYFYLFLVRVPLDIIHEALKIRKQPPNIKPSFYALKPLIRECKETLKTCIHAKIYYKKKIESLSCGLSHDKEFDLFESDLQDMFNLYCSYMASYVSFPELNRSNFINILLEDEWKFCKTICVHIKNGETKAAHDFCKMSGKALILISSSLKNGLQHCLNNFLNEKNDVENLKSQVSNDLFNLEKITNQSFNEKKIEFENIFNYSQLEINLNRNRGEMKELFKLARNNSIKCLQIIKSIKNDLEVASKYEIKNNYSELFAFLKGSRHVKLKFKESFSFEVFAPQQITKDTNLLNHLLNLVCFSDENYNDLNDIIHNNLSNFSSSNHFNYNFEVEKKKPLEKEINLNEINNLKNQFYDSNNSENQEFFKSLSDKQKSSSRSSLNDSLNNEENNFLSLDIENLSKERQTKPIYSNYLIFIKNKHNDVCWTGKDFEVENTPEIDSVLHKIKINGLYLVGLHSNRLVSCRRSFESLITGCCINLIEEQTTCHTSIKMSLDELKTSLFSFRNEWEKILLFLLDYFSKADITHLPEKSQLVFKKSNKEFINRCFSYGFELHKELSRILTDNQRKILLPNLYNFANHWMTFATTCEKGKGVKPRWAFPGFEYLKYLMIENYINELSNDVFEKFKSNIKSCLDYVISSKPVHVSTPEMIQSISESPKLFSGSHPNSRTSTPSSSSKPSSAKTTESISLDYNSGKDKKLDFARKCEFLDKRINQERINYKIIGKITDKKQELEFAFRVRKVKFKWLRGRKIGEGQFGKVYEAVNENTGELIALKRMKLQINNAKDCKKMEEEIKILESVSHPSLVKYYGVEIFSDEMFLFMEYCGNGTIADISKQELDEESIRKFSSKIIGAIYVLHYKYEIVHRDIKGANIFLMPDNSIKLGDFGSSIQLQSHSTTKGELNSFVGTAAFMAPEILNPSECGYGRAVDIWSFGCVVIQMTIGKPPWSDLENKHQIIYKVGIGTIPEVPSRLSEDGKDFLKNCLVYNPKERLTALRLLEHPFVKVEETSEIDI